jgi:iron complex outermembrane receptor protein
MSVAKTVRNKWRFNGFSVLFLLVSLSIAHSSEIDEWLELDLSALMNIKVATATKKAQLIEKVPATVRIITANQIKERAYHSLEDVLKDLPGFQFRNIQGFNSYSFQRGAPSQNNLILVLIDGIQINELNSGGFYGGYQYNLQNVRRIEVVYGPSSALYGTNAICGIINIITKDPEDSPKAEAHLTAGSFGTLFADFSHKINPTDSPFNAIIAAHYKQTEKAHLGGEEGDWNWSKEMENFENDFGIDSKINYKNVRFGITLQDKQASRTTVDTVSANFHDSGTNFHIRFINAYLNHAYSKNQKWSLKSQVYYRNATVMDNTIYVKTDSGQSRYYRPNSLLGLEEQFDYEIGEKANLVTGLVMESEKLADDFAKSFSNDPDVAPQKPPEPDFEINTLISLYFQTQYRLVKALEVTIGARLDRSSYYGTVFTPRLGVVYGKKIYTAKLLYTEAFRAPRPWDYNWEKGNPDLEPEYMKSIELANIFTLTKYSRIDLSIYRNQIRNLLEQAADKWINAEEMNTSGLEANLEYSRNKIQFYLNYTYNDSKYSDDSVVPEIAKHGLNAGIGYTLLSNLKCNLRGNYLSRRKNPQHDSTADDYYIDPYLVLNGVINYYPISKLELQLAVNNLLDARYYHPSNLAPLRYRQPQRTFLFKLGYQI